MGFILLLLLIILVGYFLTYYFTKYEHRKVSEARSTALIMGIFACLVVLTMIGISYSSCVTMRKYMATFEQFKEAIELYANKGIKEFPVGLNSGKEITDLKYNKYQDQIGEMVRDLRHRVVKYNEIYTGKKTLNDSWLFNWLIIMPGKDFGPVTMGGIIGKKAYKSASP